MIRQCYFISRESLETSVPLLVIHFIRFGMEIHVGTQEKETISEILLVAAPEHTYADITNYDGQNRAHVQLENGDFIPIVAESRY